MFQSTSIQSCWDMLLFSLFEPVLSNGSTNPSITSLLLYRLYRGGGGGGGGGGGASIQGFPYLIEVRARGLLNLGKKHLDHQYWENLMQSKRTGLPF